MSHFVPHFLHKVRDYEGLSGPPGADSKRRGIIEPKNQNTPDVAKARDFRDLPLVAAFFVWWLAITPKKIMVICGRTIKKFFDFFSIDLLAKTLFLPWKRDEIDTSNMALQDKFRVWIMNLVSRLVGLVVRLITISLGFATITLTAISGVLVSIVFMLLPLLGVGLIVIAFIIRA